MRVILAADNPAHEPGGTSRLWRNRSDVGPNSRLDRPCKYSSGNTSVIWSD